MHLFTAPPRGASPEEPDGAGATPAPALPDGTGLSGANRAYIEELYAAWLESEDAVHPSWRAFFASLGDDPAAAREAVVPPPAVRRSVFAGGLAPTAARHPAAAAPALAAVPAATDLQAGVRMAKDAAVSKLISAYRRVGHLVADLDPLGLRRSPERAELDPGHHGLGHDDLDTVFHCGRLSPTAVAPLREIIERCRAVWCGPIGVEYMYIRDERQRRWVERRMEEAGGRFPLDRATALRVLDKLTAAEQFESFIHTRYPGAKRFSIEGGEALIPMLDVMLSAAAENGVKEADIGMAHRGRLNVLANIIGKAHQDIFEEFEDRFEPPPDLVAAGDVKYHLGYSTDVLTAEGRPIHVSLAFNPSHLEFVYPVVNGVVRAKQDHFGDADRATAVPIVIHGDAAFAGQGVVAETLNLGQLPGYSVGGTIHVVVNNQVGFTTPAELTRSSEHATDVVKVVLPPVFHVNADDLGAVAFVARLAAEFRQEFQRDVVVDLWCYRKYGHNEGDEPSFTNPVMYQAVRARPSPRAVFVEGAVRDGVLRPGDAEEATERVRAHLEAELGRARAPDRSPGDLGGLWKGLLAAGHPAATSSPTRMPRSDLEALATALSRVPEGFHLHPKLRRFLDRRAEVARGEADVDWSVAEALAFASLLAEGHPVRLSGQDSGRGTFAHRHAILHDQHDGSVYMPFNHLGVPQAVCEVIDSALSENACLAFEYGYTTARPESLVIWEAQFGDFANGAQVVIDQFLSTSEDKWNRCSGLVLFLPHGYEGQGPEHSSARLERFLQLSGDDNWRVMALTTPAQLFHALRSQLHRNYRKPLVLMTPKSLLRHPKVVSTLDELANGWFHPALDDPAADPDRVDRVVLCSGKVYYDLLAAREAAGDDRAAIVRVEQLYPFPDFVLEGILSRFARARDLVWCQEEPANMGAWTAVAPDLAAMTALPVRYAGRARSAAPATGSKQLHDREQADLLRAALERPR